MMLKTVGVGTTRVKANPAVPRRARYSAVVRSRPLDDARVYAVLEHLRYLEGCPLMGPTRAYPA